VKRGKRDARGKKPEPLTEKGVLIKRPYPTLYLSKGYLRKVSGHKTSPPREYGKIKIEV
jgi:hypothetical protein